MTKDDREAMRKKVWSEDGLPKDAFLRQTLDYMRENEMTVPGDGVVAGLSGGADSVCLLILLHSLEKTLGIGLRAVHVHHGIRGGEADRDASFCERLCGRLGIACRVVRIDAPREAAEKGISVEEAGRIARYHIFEEEARAWEKEARREAEAHGEAGEAGQAAGTASLACRRARIATAHHANDNAETILHNLLRGSGLQGLGGIAPARGRVIRPLLWAESGAIREFLSEKGISWVEDSSNRENIYTRNCLRNEILPLLEERINTAAISNILRAGMRIRQADAYFEKQADEWLAARMGDACVPGRGSTEEKSGASPKNGISIKELMECEEFRRGYIVRGMLRLAGCPLKDVTARHIEEILALADKGTGKTAALPYGIEAQTEYGRLCIRRRETASAVPDFAANPDGTCKQEIRLEVFPCKNPADFPKNQYTKWFDYDKIKDTLSVRFRCPGDYFMLPSGGRKTVKSFMIDEKIPRQQRGRIPLLADGSHILWIVGYRISEYYKITGETKTILQAKLDGGKSSG